MNKNAHVGKIPRRIRRDHWLPALCVAALLAGAGCGEEPDSECNGKGHIGLQLVWAIPEQPPSALRMVLRGIIDQIRITVNRKGNPEAQTECPYVCDEAPLCEPENPEDEYDCSCSVLPDDSYVETCSCGLAEIKACPGYEVVVEGLDQGEVLYQGKVSDFEVEKNQTKKVQVVMLPVYGVDRIRPATVKDLRGEFNSDLQRIDIEWTATGDDCNLGTADSYIVYWRKNANITDETLDDAHTVPAPPPLAAGEKDSSYIGENTSGATYYIRLKVVDDGLPAVDPLHPVFNSSGLSNEAEVEVEVP